MVRAVLSNNRLNTYAILFLLYLITGHECIATPSVVRYTENENEYDNSSGTNFDHDRCNENKNNNDKN